MPLGARLRVPLPRRTLLDRTRLANPFISGGHLPRLVLVAAPPGFGKTTLLARWVGELTGQADGAHVAWLALDESDADETRFLTDLAEALAAAGVDPVETRALLATGQSVPAEQALASLINELEVAGTTVIALDDVHRAASPAVHAALGFLVDNLPPQAVVAMTTRADPPLPLARLRAAGELVEVRAADLRFTTQEADRFFTTVMGLDLTPQQVDALEARTEGWVAGLQLAAVSVRSRSSAADVDAFIGAFSGSHRFVLDYLVEQVLDAQSDEVREFLLETSILDRLTGTLADAVTGRSDGRRQLERLEAANLFVTALDEEREWFRYHQLFAEALRARLAVDHPGRVPELHLAASRCHAALGQLEDALAHALKSGDTGWAADLVELALPGTRQRRGDRSLAGWVNQLPDAVVRGRPILAITRAWSRLSNGDLAGAGDWLDLAEAAPAEPSPADPLPDVPGALLAARDAERRAAPANIAIYRAALAQATGDIAETVRQAEIALTAAPDDGFVQGASAGFLGLAAWAAGDVAAARDTFGNAVRQMALTDQLGATVVLAELALADGDPGEARRLYERALADAADAPLAALTVIADLHTGLAGVLVEQDELDLAAHHLTEARGLGEVAGLPENRFRWHVATAALLRAGGAHDAALTELDAAQLLYRPGFFPDTRPLAATRARVLIAAGRLGEARFLWATGRRVPGADPARYLDEYDVLTHARLVIAEQRTGDAGSDALDDVLGRLERILDAAVAASRRGSQVEAHLVQALARHAAGDADGAHRALGQALEGGVPSGHVRLFLDEGPPLHALLRGHAANPDHPTAPLARLLLDRAPSGTGQRPVSLGDEALSERELEVLRLLASDLTGPEIAGHLFVSINTLRTHTRHIFTKLQATTRRAAVTRARELHLL